LIKCDDTDSEILSQRLDEDARFGKRDQPRFMKLDFAVIIERYGADCPWCLWSVRPSRIEAENDSAALRTDETHLVLRKAA
jgi:hypothetical protein